MSSSKRHSFYNPVSETSFIQATNDDEAERATRRGEDLETQVSRLSISHNKSIISDNSKRKSIVQNDLPLFQLKDHFQACLNMYASNKITTKNAWQLDVFSYMQKLLKSEEETSSILQMAGSSIDVGTKIYCARIDDTHSEVLKLANALNKVHIHDINESFSEKKDLGSDDDSDTEKNEEKKQKNQKRKKKIRAKSSSGENRATAYPIDAPITTPVHSVANSAQENTDKVDFLDNAHFQKPSLLFEWFTDSEARSYKWSSLGSETPPTPTKISNTLFTNISLTKPPTNKIFNKLSNFYCDLFDENDLNYTGNETQMSNPVDNDYFVEPDDTVISEVETAANANPPGLVYITDMKPGNDNCNESFLYEYTFRSLPNISENFKVTGAWVGPSRWKLKLVRHQDSYKKPEDKVVVKKQIKRTSKCKPLEFSETNIDEIKNILGRANKRTVKKSKGAKDACTCSEYMDILEDRRISLMTRPKVQIYRSRSEKPTKTEENLNISNYDFNNLNDSEYCPTEPLENNWEEDNKPDSVLNQSVHNMSYNNDFEKTMISENEPLSYALKAKVMDMKKLKVAVWSEISCKNVEDNKEEPDNKEHIAFSQIYEALPKKLSAHLTENLSAPLAFAALLHLANENNLFLKNNYDTNDINIYK